MKIGFYDPYLDTMGGGERYCLSLVEHLLKCGWEVDMFWDDDSFQEKAVSRFDLKLEKLNVLPTHRLFKSRFVGKGYDAFFWLSDGSVPLLFSKNNILHFQVPFHGVGGGSLKNKLKLKKIHQTIVNSSFTKGFIEKEYGLAARVVWPPVDISKFKPAKKEKIVLAVGRFSGLLQAKRQDILIKTFKRMHDQGFTGWKLVLAGGTEVGGKAFFNKLKSRAKSYPIEFHENIKFEDLEKLYSQSSIFWSASGFGIDEQKNPEKVEHFGITIVEAMASGCVPLVVGKGGAKEIIKVGENGYLWDKEEELAKLTLNLVSKPKLLRKLSKNGLQLSKKFDKAKFCQGFDEVLKKNH